MEHSGLPGQGNWAGYEFMQWTGDVHHPGLDYNWGAGEQDKGKPVFAIAEGIIEKTITWNGVTKGFGNHLFLKITLDKDIEIDGHKLKAGDIIYAHYAHLDKIMVKEGDKVTLGQQIGTCGGSGGWPSHLHLEVRKPLGKGYEFWPKGYTGEWIANNYIDPYGLIEKYKGGTMIVDDQLFSKLVKNSTLADDTVKYLGLADKADDVSFDTVKNSLEAREGKLTTCKKDLANRDSELAKAIQEIQNREEQVSRLKAEATETAKLHKAELDGIKSSMPNLAKELEPFKARIELLESAYKEEAKAKGIALNSLAEAQSKLETAIAGQYDSLTLKQWLKLLLKVNLKG